MYTVDTNVYGYKRIGKDISVTLIVKGSIIVEVDVESTLPHYNVYLVGEDLIEIHKKHVMMKNSYMRSVM